jgi:hypothetical protein
MVNQFLWRNSHPYSESFASRAPIHSWKKAE